MVVCQGKVVLGERPINMIYTFLVILLPFLIFNFLKLNVSKEITQTVSDYHFFDLLIIDLILFAFTILSLVMAGCTDPGIIEKRIDKAARRMDEKDQVKYEDYLTKIRISKSVLMATQ